MKRLFSISIAVIAIAIAVNAQSQRPQPIAADPATRVGTLDNGMKYYVRHNSKQKNLANFYIVHHVGAIQESDTQQGLAHFLEHMAFNGTKNLPGKSMINYLETIGVKFGANLNASTSFDRTQYLIKDVPTIREGIIDTALLVLHDWSHFISLEPEEIDSERGVIMEELRTRDGASWRSFMAAHKALMKGSKYEQRNLIGYLDGLKSFSYKEIEDFYHTWYRPEYQAVVVVGDIDADAIVTKLRTLMSDIAPSPSDAPKKEVIMVPENKIPIISITQDPETMESSASLMIKHASITEYYRNTVVYKQLGIISRLAGMMMRTRFKEMSMLPDAPFNGASIIFGSIGTCPTMSSVRARVSTKDGELMKGLEALLTEIEGVRKNGFTTGEFERAKSDLRRSLEKKYANRDDRTNEEYVRQYVSSFLFNYPMPDAETDWQIDSMLLSNVPLTAVNKAVSKLITDDNRVFTIDVPVKEGLKVPTEAEVLALNAKMQTIEIAPRKDDVVMKPLIPESVVLKGSPVAHESTNDTLGTTEWTLKNGVRIIVKPTKFKADEVFVNLNSKVGISSVTDSEYITAEYLSNIMEMLGIGEFSSSDLKKQMAGIDADVSIDTDRFSSSVVGSGSPKDMESILQLVYLTFTSPRFDEKDFTTAINQYRSYAENLDKDPSTLLDKEIAKALYSSSPRHLPFSKDVLDKIDFKVLPSVYSKLFGSISGFTVTIVGNVDCEKIKPLVEKYIGSIPAKKSKLKQVDDKADFAKGVVTADFKAQMKQPKVSLARIYTGDIDYILKNILAVNFLQQILRVRYTASIREEKGGTYGVSVRAQTTADPRGQYKISISFDTNEQMADELSEIVVDEIRAIAANGPKEQDVEKIRSFMLKQWKNSLQFNRQWTQIIRAYYSRGIDMVSEYETTVSGITCDDIKTLAQKIISDNNMVYVIMRPEK